MQAQIEAEQEQRTEWGVRTRRTNKLENVKTKRMCEALAKAEKAKALPAIEGELPDMPEGSADEDFDENEGKRARGKRGKQKANNIAQSTEAVDKARKKADSLFHRFGLA